MLWAHWWEFSGQGTRTLAVSTVEWTLRQTHSRKPLWEGFLRARHCSKDLRCIGVLDHLLFLTA